jgi:hypothetical protein
MIERDSLGERSGHVAWTQWVLTVLLPHTIAATALLLVGCASTPAGTKDLLTFLDRSDVTRDDVYQHLGEPSAVFDASHVVTYRLTQTSAGLSVAHRADWKGVTHDLVLVFDDKGVLQKHNLVSVRAPRGTQ